jgi:hypothetical protein
MIGPQVLLWATLILVDLAVAFAVAFASTCDARYLAFAVACVLFAVCTSEPIRQPAPAEVQS